MMWNAVSSKAQPPNLGLSQDPFRGGDNILVMADAYEPPRDIDGKHIDMKPIPTNTRYSCMEAMEKVMDEEPWFGIEQVCRKSFYLASSRCRQYEQCTTTSLPAQSLRCPDSACL